MSAGFSNLMVVGLTGQTGAGKSTVSKIFEQNGFAIIDADKVSRKVVEKGTDCLEEIKDIFGMEVILENGELNRAALGSIVFSDKIKLETLDTIVYPYITKEILKMIQHYSSTDVKFVLLDAPTLFESHSDDFCDLIISVIADADIRKHRIIARDGITDEQAEKRMNSQLSEEFFVSHSDFIIQNNGNIDIVNETSKEVSDKIKHLFMSRQPVPTV
ncbi:MAG: dephospho-CoA kinase [Ruminococcus sp.]|nr:dephospho-CoA kinase [Ruminococcus sp.]